MRSQAYQLVTKIVAMLDEYWTEFRISIAFDSQDDLAAATQLLIDKDITFMVRDSRLTIYGNR